MRLNVTHKLTIGFALMVLFIIVVGMGGLLASRTISDHLFKVSDDVIPSLSGSFQQMIYLEEVNSALFGALSQVRIKDLNRKRKAVKARIAEFNEEQARVAEKIAGHPELTEQLNSIQQVSQQFFDIAEKVMAERKHALILDFQIRQAEIDFQERGNSLNLWNQGLSTQRPSPSVMRLVEDMNLLFRMHRFQLIDFQRTGDMEKLTKLLQENDGELLKAMESLKPVVSKVPILERTIRAINNHLYSPDDGLVNYYSRQAVAKQQLADNLKTTDQLIAQAREAVKAFIVANNQLVSDARSEAEQQVGFSTMWILGLSVGSVLFALILGYALVQTIRIPLARIHQGLSALGQGDLGVAFEVQRQDEFGDLSRYLNTVVAGLKDILQQVSDGAERLSDVAQRNAAISQQTTQAMSIQGAKLEQTSSAAVEMEHSVAEVAEHSQTTLHAVRDFEQLSQDVNRQMLGTIKSIETQATGIDQAMGVSNEMTAFGDQIASILSTIQGIADKTNLLALNAAIEAARAGEQGRGFAVVADEVRSLAGRTRESVLDIQQMLESMQDAIQRVSTVMNQSFQQTQNCVESANQSQQVLQAMNDAVAHIRDMNTYIETAATEQTTAVGEVSQTLVAINTVAGETSQGAEQAAESSNELLDVVRQQQTLLQRFSMN